MTVTLDFPVWVLVKDDKIYGAYATKALLEKAVEEDSDGGFYLWKRVPLVTGDSENLSIKIS